MDGIVYLCGDRSHITILDEVRVLNLDVKKLTSKAKVEAKYKDLDVSFDLQSSVAKMKERLTLHKKNVEKQYVENGFEYSTINFWNKTLVEQPKFSAICIIDSQLMYADCSTENAIVAVTTSLDGVGVRGSIQCVFSYDVHWKTIFSLHCFGQIVCCLVSWNRNY